MFDILHRFLINFIYISFHLVSSNDSLYCRYYLGIPEGRPGQLHLYRTSSSPPQVGVPLNAPQCLTCQPEQPSHHPYSAYYASMAGGRSGANSEGESEEWGEEDDETTPAPTQSPLKNRKG
jgi:hypothetical protein